jgi:hypothetical protein
VKHQTEKLHPTLATSLRANEEIPRNVEGDATAGKRDMTAEQRKAFQKPGNFDVRVAKSEANQGRTD